MKLLKDFDFLLFVPIVLLLLFGIVVLSSTSNTAARDQLIFVFIGLTVFLVCSFLDFRILKEFSLLLYLFNVFLLIITLGFGIYSKGAVRWIPLGIGGFTFQPSEFMKLSLIISISGFLSNRLGRSDFRDFIFSIIIVLVPSVLIFVQPDLGTAMVMWFIWLSIILGARLRLVYLVYFFLVLILVSPLFLWSLKPYQRQRIEYFFSPSSDPLGSGYHVLQSQIAVGSGMITGRGFGRGTQSHLRFLPEYHTDFIFASLAEEWGFLGAIVVLLLFGLIFFRITLIGIRSPSLFGQFLSLGVLVMIFVQAVINISMNLGIAPITGVPLPLLSSGGSSLVLTMASLGLIESVARGSGKV